MSYAEVESAVKSIISAALAEASRLNGQVILAQKDIDISSNASLAYSLKSLEPASVQTWTSTIRPKEYEVPSITEVTGGIVLTDPSATIPVWESEEPIDEAIDSVAQPALPAEYPVPTTDSVELAADLDVFNATVLSLKNQAISVLANFFTTYFGDHETFWDAGLTWVTDVITNGGTGIPQAVEDQIWQRDRNRLLYDQLRAEEEVVERWGQRGFTLPSGYLVYQVDKTTADYYNKIAESSNNVAVKTADMELKSVHFAVEQTIKMNKAVAFDAAIKYTRTVMLDTLAPSVDLSKSRLETKASLISACASYYNARINATRLQYEAAFKEYDADVSISTARISAQAPLINAAATRFNAELNGAKLEFDFSVEKYKGEIELAKIGAGEYAGLISASANYYNARVNAAKLEYETALKQLDNKITYTRDDYDFVLKKMGHRITGMAHIADAAARAAAAAYSSINAIGILNANSTE